MFKVYYFKNYFFFKYCTLFVITMHLNTTLPVENWYHRGF